MKASTGRQTGRPVLVSWQPSLPLYPTRFLTFVLFEVLHLFKEVGLWVLEARTREAVERVISGTMDKV